MACIGKVVYVEALDYCFVWWLVVVVVVGYDNKSYNSSERNTDYILNRMKRNEHPEDVSLRSECEIFSIYVNITFRQ